MNCRIMDWTKQWKNSLNQRIGYPLTYGEFVKAADCKSAMSRFESGRRLCMDAGFFRTNHARCMGLMLLI